MRLFEEIIKEALNDLGFGNYDDYDTVIGSPDDEEITQVNEPLVQNEPVVKSRGRKKVDPTSLFKTNGEYNDVSPDRLKRVYAQGGEEGLKNLRHDLKNYKDTDALKNDFPGKFVKVQTKYAGEKWALDLGGGSCYAIYTAPEMQEIFTRVYRKGKPVDAKSLRDACADNFFFAWINKASFYITDQEYVSNANKKKAQKASENDSKERIAGELYNLGNGLEYIFGMAKNNKAGADVDSTDSEAAIELKAYSENAPTVTLFSLSPYEFIHYPDQNPGTLGKQLSGEEVKNKLKEIATKIGDTADRGHTISSNEETQYQASNSSRSYASVIIETDENTGSQKAQSFKIVTDYFKKGFDEKTGKPIQIPIDRIECLYSISETQEVLYAGTQGDSKRNFYHTVKDKVQTIFDFSTVQLETQNFTENGEKVGGNILVAYSKLKVHTIQNLDDLMLNFIEAINKNYFQIYFTINGSSLMPSSNFNVVNKKEAWDLLYGERQNKLYMQENGTKNLGEKKTMIETGENKKEEKFDKEYYDKLKNSEYDFSALPSALSKKLGQRVGNDLRKVDNKIKSIQKKEREKKKAEEEERKKQEAIANGTYVQTNKRKPGRPKKNA